MNEFLLTIIIPTKDRQSYAQKAVQQILSIDDQRIQVVIQDNSATDKLSSMLSIYKNDKRLKYNYQKGIISFVDNFNLAVSLASGEYICIIGDDDGLTPQIIEVTDWASRNNIDAIKPELSAVYFWPNSKALNQMTDDGYMRIGKITGGIKEHDPSKEVIKLLNNGCQKYLSLNLVKLYHGLVKRSKLEIIKEKTGKYFGGLSPDIYIAVALSLTIDKVIELDFPLTISGICSVSGSAESATGKHVGVLEEAPHFRGHDAYKWSALVPKFYSVETIWADSALAAICDLKKMELLNEFNNAALAVYCMKKYPKFKKIVRDHYKNQLIDYPRIQLVKAYFQHPITDFIKRVYRKIKRKKNDHMRINGIENIIMANEIIQERLIDIGFNMNKNLKTLKL